MAKDPAALFYIDKWLVATKGMRGNVKGWYLNLILFQYDMGDLPNDIEELANLADVRISEYEEFKQVFEQVLSKKFEQNDSGRLENDFAREIIHKRKLFKDKRSGAGKMSYFVQYLTKNYKLSKAKIEYLKDSVNLTDLDLKNEQVLKQVIEHNLELYINVNKDISKDVFIDKYSVFKKIAFFNDDDFQAIWIDFIKIRKTKKAADSERAMKSLAKRLSEYSKGSKDIAMEIVRKSAEGGWSDIYPLNGQSSPKRKHDVSNDEYRNE